MRHKYDANWQVDFDDAADNENKKDMDQQCYHAPCHGKGVNEAFRKAVVAECQQERGE